MSIELDSHQSPVWIPPSTERVDISEFMPDLRSFVEIFGDDELRKRVPDGMTLVAGYRPRGDSTWEDVVSAYEDWGGEGGAWEFWQTYMEEIPPSNDLDAETEGMALEEYISYVSEKLKYDFKDTRGFSLELPNVNEVPAASRFPHAFGWDSYKIAKMLAAEGEWGGVKRLIENMEYQIEELGGVANSGTLAPLATRMQLPYFGHMVSMYAEHDSSALARFLPSMEKAHSYWMSGREELERRSQEEPDKAHAYRNLVRLPDGTYMNRNWDDAMPDEMEWPNMTEEQILRIGPRLESYKEDLEDALAYTKDLTGEGWVVALAKFFANRRAAAASGHDFTDGLADATDIIPNDLNSLVAYDEQLLTKAHAEVGNVWKAAYYERLAEERIQAITRLNWDNESKIFRDYNFVKGEQVEILRATMAYPLYVGIVNGEQAMGVAKAIDDELLLQHGVAATNKESGQQWDKPWVWPFTTWVVNRGLARAADMGPKLGLSNEEISYLSKISDKVSDSFQKSVEYLFEQTGVVFEKMHGEDLDMTTKTEAGEYKIVKHFLVSIGIYKALKHRCNGSSLPLDLARTSIDYGAGDLAKYATNGANMVRLDSLLGSIPIDPTLTYN